VYPEERELEGRESDRINDRLLIYSVSGNNQWPSVDKRNSETKGNMPRFETLGYRGRYE